MTLIRTTKFSHHGDASTSFNGDSIIGGRRHHCRTGRPFCPVLLRDYSRCRCDRLLASTSTTDRWTWVLLSTVLALSVTSLPSSQASRLIRLPGHLEYSGGRYFSSSPWPLPPPWPPPWVASQTSSPPSLLRVIEACDESSRKQCSSEKFSQDQYNPRHLGCFRRERISQDTSPVTTHLGKIEVTLNFPCHREADPSMLILSPTSLLYSRYFHSPVQDPSVTMTTRPSSRAPSSLLSATKASTARIRSSQRLKDRNDATLGMTSEVATGPSPIVGKASPTPSAAEVSSPAVDDGITSAIGSSSPVTVKPASIDPGASTAPVESDISAVETLDNNNTSVGSADTTATVAMDSPGLVQRVPMPLKQSLVVALILLLRRLLIPSLLTALLPLWQALRLLPQSHPSLYYS